MKNTFKSNKKYPLVIQQFEEVWAVWFKKSRSFLLLAEPAFMVLQYFLAGKRKTEIKDEIISRYSHAETDIDTFVDEIIQYIRQYNNPRTYIQVSKKNEAISDLQTVGFKFSKNYKFGNTVLTIDYQDEWMQHLIHPSFMHHETQKLSKPANHIRCYRTKNFIILTRNNRITEAFDLDAVEYYKGAVSQLVYSILYKKRFSGWMCTLHASGIHHNNKAFVFSAAAGSGKSTTSAILKASGLDYISDDFIAATPDGNVYPFPASISVKDGSFKVLSGYYPELGDKVLEKAATGKMVRYLPANNFSEIHKNGIPVNCFIFVDFKSEIGFELNPVTKKEALQFLLKETWVNPTSDYVSAFFEWIEKTNFYRMTYSDNVKMINSIKKLIGYDV
jgi:hypothetical protein